MADNVDITPGAGATVATDDVDGVQYQRVKLAHGVDGEAADVASDAGLPVIGQRARLQATIVGTGDVFGPIDVSGYTSFSATLLGGTTEDAAPCEVKVMSQDYLPPEGEDSPDWNTIVPVWFMDGLVAVYDNRIRAQFGAHVTGNIASARYLKFTCDQFDTYGEFDAPVLYVELSTTPAPYSFVAPLGEQPSIDGSLEPTLNTGGNYQRTIAVPYSYGSDGTSLYSQHQPDVFALAKIDHALGYGPGIASLVDPDAANVRIHGYSMTVSADFYCTTEGGGSLSLVMYDGAEEIYLETPFGMSFYAPQAWPGVIQTTGWVDLGSIGHRYTVTPGAHLGVQWSIPDQIMQGMIRVLVACTIGS